MNQNNVFFILSSNLKFEIYIQTNFNHGLFYSSSEVKNNQILADNHILLSIKTLKFRKF